MARTSQTNRLWTVQQTVQGTAMRTKPKSATSAFVAAAVAVVAAALLAALVGALLVAPASNADSGRSGSYDMGENRVRYVAAANTRTQVTATAKLDRLPRSGNAVFFFDTAFDDSHYGDDYHGWSLELTKRAGDHVAAQLVRASSTFAPRADVDCPGHTVAWDRSRDRIRVTVPADCFGVDQGMMRVGFEGPYEVTGEPMVHTLPLQQGPRGRQVQRRGRRRPLRRGLRRRP